ncbi:MAG: glycosyltransferase [Solirubrobacteraceae bacterium]
MSVCAVICTFNKRELLLECLDALAAQTDKLDRVIIVDNASNDGTLTAIAGSEAARALNRVDYIELAENAGASGGFAEAIAQALAEEHDWIWVIDNDCMPAPDALAQLLASEKASDPSTVALCTATRSVDGHLQTEYRGAYRDGRPIPFGEEVYAEPAVRLGYAAFAGLLVRADAVRHVGTPKPEFFLWIEDLEWCIRLGQRGDIWLIPASEILHKDGNPQIPHGLLSYLRRSLRGQPDTEIWKHVLAFRNMSWVRREYHGERLLGGFARHLAQHWFRVLLFDRSHKLRRMRWYLEYGLAGRRSEFRNCQPEVWVMQAGRPGGARAIREASIPGVALRRVRGPFDPTASSLDR